MRCAVLTSVRPKVVDDGPQVAAVEVVHQHAGVDPVGDVELGALLRRSSVWAGQSLPDLVAGQCPKRCTTPDRIHPPPRYHGLRRTALRPTAQPHGQYGPIGPARIAGSCCGNANSHRICPFRVIFTTRRARVRHLTPLSNTEAHLGSPSSAPQLNTNPGSLTQRNSSSPSRTRVTPWPSARAVSITRSRWPSVSNTTSCPAWKPMISPPSVATMGLCTQQDAKPGTADRSAQSPTKTVFCWARGYLVTGREPFCRSTRRPQRHRATHHDPAISTKRSEALRRSLWTTPVPLHPRTGCAHEGKR